MLVPIYAGPTALVNFDHGRIDGSYCRRLTLSPEAHQAHGQNNITQVISGRIQSKFVQVYFPFLGNHVSSHSKQIFLFIVILINLALIKAIHVYKYTSRPSIEDTTNSSKISVLLLLYLSGYFNNLTHVKNLSNGSTLNI